MIASISGRSLSESAPAGVDAKAKAAAANAAIGSVKRRFSIAILLGRSMSELLRFVIHNIVRLDPAGGSGRKTLLRAQRKLPRGADITAIEGGLRGKKIGVRLVALARIGDGKLAITDRSGRLFIDRHAQFMDGFVSERAVVRLHQRLPEENADERRALRHLHRAAKIRDRLARFPGFQE